MSTLHYRIRSNVQVREDGTSGRRFWIRALTYNVEDSYRTAFAPGLFTDSLAEDMPVYVYGHDYWNFSNLLGRYVDSRSTDEHLDLLLELDDPDAVPGAKQASAQLRSGTLRRFSVGFELLDDEKWDRDPKVQLLTRGRLIEVSSVIDPAVPGTKVLAQVRSSRRVQDALHRADIDPSKLTLATLQEMAEQVERFGLSKEQARILLSNELAAQKEAAKSDAESTGERSDETAQQDTATAEDGQQAETPTDGGEQDGQPDQEGAAGEGAGQESSTDAPETVQPEGTAPPVVDDAAAIAEAALAEADAAAALVAGRSRR